MGHSFLTTSPFDPKDLPPSVLRQGKETYFGQKQARLLSILVEQKGSGRSMNLSQRKESDTITALQALTYDQNRAVSAAAKPKTIPGALAITIGQSALGCLNIPQMTQRVQLIAATSGWIQSPLCPARLPRIVLIQDTYIKIAVIEATVPRIVKNRDRVINQTNNQESPSKPHLLLNKQTQSTKDIAKIPKSVYLYNYSLHQLITSKMNQLSHSFPLISPQNPSQHSERLTKINPTLREARGSFTKRLTSDNEKAYP